MDGIVSNSRVLLISIVKTRGIVLGAEGIISGYIRDDIAKEIVQFFIHLRYLAIHKRIITNINLGNFKNNARHSAVG